MDFDTYWSFLMKKAAAKIFIFYLIIATVVGSRLGHVFFYSWDYYSQNQSEILKVWHGGLASHGGAIGVLVAMFLY